MMEQTPTATPMPTPALAPEDKPLRSLGGEGVVLDIDVVLKIWLGASLDEIALLGDDASVTLVDNSFSLNSTMIGSAPSVPKSTQMVCLTSKAVLQDLLAVGVRKDPAVAAVG